jgi:hypothetical protein
MSTGPKVFLAELNPFRAFWLFVVALFLGSYFTFQNIAIPYLPVLVIIAYGLALSYSQSRFFVQFSSIIKDSPYFLGFMFTLMGLLAIFRHLSQFDEIDEMARGFLYEGVAVALLTTVVGLVMRHWLYATDRLEADRDNIFTSLADQLRDQTKRFSHSQRTLVELIEEFTNSREQMFGQEERAFREYVSRLERSASTLAGLEEVFATRLDDTLAEFARSSSGLSEAAGKSLRQIEDLQMAIQEALRVHRNDLDRLREENEHTLRKSYQTVTEGLNEMRSATDRLMDAVEQNLRRVAAIPDHHQTIVGQLTSAAEDIVIPLRELGGEMRALQEQVAALPGHVSRIPQDLAEPLAELTSSVQDHERKVQESLATILEDLKAIDNIVDQVVDILHSRLVTLSG